MDFSKYPYDSHRCKYLMGSTGFPDSLMAFDSTFSFSESTQRPLQYSVRLLSTLLLNQFDMPIEEHAFGENTNWYAFKAKNN